MRPEQIVERAAPDRVLVFGSLPPQVRDLDLLARPSEQRAVAAALQREGFDTHYGEWVRFRDCSVDVVDLVPAAQWHLSDAQLEALFQDALPVDGFTRLVRPAPHHTLLIMARRLAGGDGRLDGKLRARLDAALAHGNPDCWDEARRRAIQWGAGRALEQLRQA